MITADNGGDNTLDETYTYSPTGNLLSRTRIGTYTYPTPAAVRPHAATQIGAKTLSYDANGNMVSDGTRTLTWDASNRLSTVTQNGAAVTLSYGPDGSRMKKSWAFGTTLYRRLVEPAERPALIVAINKIGEISASQTFAITPGADYCQGGISFGAWSSVCSIYAAKDAATALNRGACSRCGRTVSSARCFISKLVAQWLGNSTRIEGQET